MNFDALREISILKELRHPNIINIQEVLYNRNNLFLSYDYIEYDLVKLIYDEKSILSESIIKGIFLQILQGMNEIHRFGVLHRDMKPHNILISKAGVVKIADFGMSRFISSPDRGMTKNTVTSWYRAPELFFGANYYSFSIDMWSAGCILGELIQQKPLFSGNTDIDILKSIFLMLGVANVNSFKSYSSPIIGQMLMNSQIMYPLSK